MPVREMDMYKADGFDLSKSSYEMLKEFSVLNDGEQKTFSDDETHDISVLNRLLELGLVKKGPWGGGKASFAITQLGRDFIEDYDFAVRSDRKARWMRLGHDLFIALVGFASAIVVWALTKYC